MTAFTATRSRIGTGSSDSELAREIGFSQVSVSHRVSPLMKLVGRGDTTVVDAYLSPILRRYVDRVAGALGDVRLWVGRAKADDLLFGSAADHRRIVATEIVLEPDIDAGHDQSVLADPNAARTVDVSVRSGFEHAFHGGRGIGLPRKVGATDGGAVDRVVNARVLPDRPEDAMLDVVTESLGKGDNVTLTGFVTFEVRDVKARTGVNPRTKERIQIPASKRAAFKPGAVLKRSVGG